MERFGIHFKSMTGGRRCLREAVSIRPPPGRRRVRSTWPSRPTRRRSLSGVRGDTAGVKYFYITPIYHHIIISSYQQTKKSVSQFWPKSLGKNRNRLFYPSTKNPRELNFGTSGVTFRDERHGNAQKFTAPPNRHFTCFETTFETLQNLQTAGKSRG